MELKRTTLTWLLFLGLLAFALGFLRLLPFPGLVPHLLELSFFSLLPSPRFPASDHSCPGLVLLTCGSLMLIQAQIHLSWANVHVLKTFGCLQRLYVHEQRTNLFCFIYFHYLLRQAWYLQDIQTIRF